MTTIYLIRHAEAEGNLYRRVHGWYDALITDNGLRQIKALEQRFRDIPVDGVWSSDLYRTRTTARAVYLPKGLELNTDPQLREIHLGEWEDGTWGGVYHADPEGMIRFNRSDPTWRAPGGEDLAEVGQRMEQAIRRIASQYPDGTVAIFSHGTAIRQFTANVKGLSPEEWCTMGHSDNTAVTQLTWDGEGFTLVLEGDNSHLDESISTLARQAWWKKDGPKKRDVNLHFRPIRWEEEQHIYLEARREAWVSTHGPDIPFDAEGFLQGAREDLNRSPWGVTLAFHDDRLAGLIQLDERRYCQEGAGYIAFCYVQPTYRAQGLGIQLVGQAVAHFRPLGRDKLRLRCAPYNARAQHFYGKYGFVKIGEEAGSRVPLDILEKYIGYNR